MVRGASLTNRERMKEQTDTQTTPKFVAEAWKSQPK